MRWKPRWGMWSSGTRACARSSRSAMGCRGSRFWMHLRRGHGSRSRALRRRAWRRRWRARRGRDSICRVSRRCGRICSGWRRTSTCCCCWCTTSPGTAGRWRRWGATCRGSTRRAAKALRPICRACRCNMPTTRCGSMGCWGMRRTQRARSGASSGTGPRRSRTSPSRSTCRATAHGLRCRAIGARAYRSSCLRSCTQAFWSFRGRAARACSWCCRPPLRRC